MRVENQPVPYEDKEIPQTFEEWYQLLTEGLRPGINIDKEIITALAKDYAKWSELKRRYPDDTSEHNLRRIFRGKLPSWFKP